MFRTILKKQRFLFIQRRLHDSKLPYVKQSVSRPTKYTGKDSPRKYDYNSTEETYKATRGNGKSIYDCENESWTVSDKENTVWTINNSRED